MTMTDNNITNGMSSDAEYEKMIEEYLNSQEESDEPTKYPETISCAYGGTSYRVPSCIAPAGYTFRSAELRLDGTNLMEKQTNFKACLSESMSRSSFSLYISQITKEDFCDKEPAYALLYKKGRREPLAEKKGVPDDDGFYLDMSELSDNLQPGNYFILVGNLYPDLPESHFERMGNNFRFSFSLLPDGIGMPHPDIRKVGIARELPFLSGTSGKLRLSVSLSRPMGKLDEFTAYCYDESLFLMDKATLSRSAEMPRSRKIDIVFDSPYIWTEGKYSCLVCHNGEPFFKIHFLLDGEKAEICGKELIKRNSPDYVLAKYMEKDRRCCFYWGKLRRTAGFGEVKRKAMEYFQDCAFNLLRKDYDLKPIRRNMNFLFIGEERNDTESVINDFAFILCHTRKFRYIDAESLTEPKNTPDPYSEIGDTLDECTDGVCCLTNVSTLPGSGGRILRQKIEKMLRAGKNCTLFIRATRTEAAQLFEACPDLKACFPDENRVELCGYSLRDAVHALQNVIKSEQLCLTEKAELKLSEVLAGMVEKGELRDWGKEEVEEFFRASVLPHYRQRILDIEYTDGECAKRLFSMIEEEDIQCSAVSDGESSFSRNMKELAGMTGLEDVKALLGGIFNHIRFNDIRRRMGLPAGEEHPHHMVFVGNPGTGKTTVAKMIGKICHSIGILSKGDVIVTERSQIVGQYLGETEKNMQAVLKQAQGNVLFIDEAYTLTAAEDGKRDFGHRAVECLLTALARQNPDMIVILAGYEKEMDGILGSNPGLRGRFPHILHFKDYSADELMQIAQRILEREAYVLGDEARIRLYETVCETVATPSEDFSNARWIEQYVSNGILPAMADRVLNHCRSFDRQTCRTVEKEDVETAYRRFRPRRIEVPSTPRIGFRA